LQAHRFLAPDPAKILLGTAMGEMPPSPTVPMGRPRPSASVSYTGPGSLLVRVGGEIDTAGVPVVQSALDGVWSQGASRVIIDLTDVTFIGLPGLHVLLQARRTAARRRMRIVVRARSGHMHRLLGLVGAGDITERLGSAVPSAAGTATAPRPAVVRRRSEPDLEPVLRALRWSATNPAEDLPDALRSVAETAATYLPGAEGAGVLLVSGDRCLVSQAATDPVVQILDLVQQEWECGPAWQTAWTGEDLTVDDLAADPRWPDVVAEVAGLGVRSLLCLHLGAAGEQLGALTVYSSGPAEFGGSVLRLGQALASIATIAIAVGRSSGGRTCAVAAGDPRRMRDTRARAVRRRAGPGVEDGLTDTGEP
jgi:anti-anti-sigma factor